MNRKFYIALLFIAFTSFSSSVFAQDVNEYYSKAKKFINKSKLDSATFYLSKALEISPDNLEILEDLLYVQYLDRDFVKAVSLGKNLAARADAGVKTFQLVGMTYKEIAEFKEAKKVYDKALLKFPNSGMLYSEYADLFSQMQKPAEAIKLWEKGIEVDPGFNSNYYFASKYYAETNNMVWALLYGETFVNIESLTDRTVEIKQMLADLYKHISTPGFLNGKGNVFAQSVVSTLSKQPPIPMNNLNVKSLTLMRMNFMNDWNKENNAKFPFKLFEYHNQLIKEGLFDAYNQWLFSAFDADAYEAWKQANKQKQAAFQNFVGGRVYKIPAGQYYQTK
jgi:tetratricopeptide (TPR) repeat protein